MTRLLVTEKEWKAKVIETARLFGWRYAHFLMAKTKRGWRTPQEGDLGFPDMVLVRPPRLIIVELKAHPPAVKAGQPSEGQAEWLNQLRAVPGVETYLWWPGDWEQVYLTLAKDSQP